jgi:hypothetical protein
MGEMRQPPTGFRHAQNCSLDIVIKKSTANFWAVAAPTAGRLQAIYI